MSVPAITLSSTVHLPNDCNRNTVTATEANLSQITNGTILQYVIRTVFMFQSTIRWECRTYYILFSLLLLDLTRRIKIGLTTNNVLNLCNYSWSKRGI